MLLSSFAAILGSEFLTNVPVRTAIVVGGGAALVSAVIGVFTVIRGQSFSGHVLADVSSAGGAASFLLGINPLLGFLGMAVLAAVGMEVVQIRRVRERDLVAGVVLGAGLGLTALLLYLDVTTHSTTGAAITIMFGSMFAMPASIIWPALWVGAISLGLVALFYRPLLLCSVDAELAAVQGIRVRWVTLTHMLVLALSVSLSAITVGAILSTALLIGPAAIALRLSRRPISAIVLAGIIGVGVTLGGILLAWRSYYWTPGHGWPVSFFVVALILALYIAAGWWARWSKRPRGHGMVVPTSAREEA